MWIINTRLHFNRISRRQKRVESVSNGSMTMKEIADQVYYSDRVDSLHLKILHDVQKAVVYTFLGADCVN
jgi:hypothetical protein